MARKPTLEKLTRTEDGIRQEPRLNTTAPPNSALQQHYLAVTQAEWQLEPSSESR